ncbi:acyltransferase [Halobacillus sp. Nhm2S1]|uniref:acyltransferase family protein n=1 Tax=Halobacillus sp. Nhm2S1 TaxID=2866716 RepID=UPI001C73D494|nr:acyltransferase [Halobacillus sp. Nhm2S1]MBX0357649.1 acyltransferase [Halobacillus sp. Nhm2S1]
MKQRNSGKMEIIQISRALAIVFVLIGHANNNFYQEIGYDWFNVSQWDRTGGVDFFFIVTGFMIYYLYNKHAGNKEKATQFLIKRLLRIFPLYWFFTTLALIVPIAFPMLQEGYRMEVILKSFLLLTNEPILSSAWSLTHIVFFYLLFFAYMYKPVIMKPFIGLWIGLTILGEMNIVSFFPSSIFSISVVEIFCGSLVAYFSIHYKNNYAGLCIVTGLAGYLLVWVHNVYSLNFIPLSLAYGFCSMLMMYGIAEKDKIKRNVPHFLSYLGGASYSIYIAHGPFVKGYLLIFVELHFFDHIHPFFGMITIILLVIASCCIVYNVVEKPLVETLRRKVLGKKRVTQPVPHLVAK